MTEYKIFASDLDGTMLNKKSEMSQENFYAIKKILEQGVEFIPVTGRCIAETDEAILNCGIKYIINSNGASIYNVETKVAHITSIKTEGLKKVFDILKDYEVVTVAHSNNCVFVDTDECSEEYFRYHRMSEAYVKAIYSVAIPTEFLKKKLLTDTPAEMLALFFKNENERLECTERFKDIKEISFTSSVGGNMELLDNSVSKGSTLKKLAAVLGVKPSEIIIAGDNHNDISMTETAGLSLAVSGAVNEMKQKCDKTICSNNDHVAEYVYKNFINI